MSLSGLANNGGAAPPNGPFVGAITDQGGQAYNVCAPQWGAKGDGVTLDHVAINACLAAANAAAPNGALILFPHGKTFLTGAPITPHLGQTLQGYGATLKRRNQATSAFSGAVVANVTSTLTGVTSTAGFAIGDVIAIFNGATIGTQNHVITAVTASTITCSTAFVVSLPAGGTVCHSHWQLQVDFSHISVMGLTLDGNKANFGAFTQWNNLQEINQRFTTSVGCNIIDCVIQNAPCEGVIIEGIKCVVERCTIQNITGDGIHLAGSNCVVQNNYITNTNLASSLHIPQGAICYSATNPGHRIVGNQIDTCSNGIATADSFGADSCLVGENEIKNAGVNPGAGGTSFSIFFSGSSAQNVTAHTYRNNKCYGTNGGARFSVNDTATVYPTGATAFDFDGNYFEGGVSFIQIHDCRVRGNHVNLAGNTTVVCLYFQDCSGVHVSDNRAIGGSYGIECRGITNPCTHLLIEDNHCQENFNAGINTFTGVTAPVVIQGNKCRGTSGTVVSSWVGIYNQGSVPHCEIVGNSTWTNGASSQSGIRVTGGGVSGSTTGSIITGNRTFGGATSVRLDGGFNHLVKHNQLTLAVTDSSTASTVSDNDLIV